MKIFKKIIAAVAAAAIAITALPMSAFGEDYWKTNAKTIQRDKEYSFTLPDNTSDTVHYKFEMKFPGYLVLDVSSTADITLFDLCSETSNYGYFANCQATKGSAGYSNIADYYSFLTWDSNAKMRAAVLSVGYFESPISDASGLYRARGALAAGQAAVQADHRCGKLYSAPYVGVHYYGKTC